VSLQRVYRTVVLACNLAVGVQLHSAFLSAQDSASELETQIAARIDANQLDAALKLADLAVGRYPNSSQMQQLLGVVLFKMGSNEQARTAFRRAIELDPGIAQNYYDLALVNLSEKQYAQAVPPLEACLRLDPSNAEAHVLLGRAYHNLNQTALAIEQFEKAIAIEPQLPLAHYHLGYAYQSQGNLNGALEEFKKEIQDNPTFYNSFWLAGNIELQRGEPDAAAELFGKGVHLKPQAWQAHYGLGRALTMKKQWTEAEAELKKALEASGPDNVEINYALARLYQQTGRRADAEREFQICSRLNAQRQRTGSGIAGQQQ
jgi:tetratricopeptide (TPR) repeat protein